MQNNPQPPAPNWASTHEGPAQQSWIAPMILGAILLATGCGGGLVAGWFAGVASTFGQDLLDYAAAPFDADFQIQAPNSVAINKNFDITVTVTDTSGKDRTVIDIDFDEFLDAGVQIINVDPTPIATFSDGTYREHTFETPLRANQSETFVFTVRAVTKPMVEGSITVYLDAYASQSSFITVNVIDALPNSDPDSFDQYQPDSHSDESDS